MSQQIQLYIWAHNFFEQQYSVLSIEADCCEKKKSLLAGHSNKGSPYAQVVDLFAHSREREETVPRPACNTTLQSLNTDYTPLIWMRNTCSINQH